jgi:hypothetical protein
VWPAVLKYSGEDELLLIKDESTWLADDDLSAYVYDENDMLIDSNGALYALNYHVKTRQIHVNPQKKTVSIDQFEGWVKNHLALLNQCCSSKLTLSSITDGLVLLEQLAEQSGD